MTVPCVHAGEFVLKSENSDEQYERRGEIDTVRGRGNGNDIDMVAGETVRGRGIGNDNPVLEQQGQ
ncbi:hypothetical protein TSUD_178410 [Trifolium subterraneum]|uniref:Uncharacterized protein n=1 Tax=Trifolium subterraneum TaxID=3900 RepID=A0A2Z6LY40_TRISU|nr:hypothetical protein TSUD_178410 [Trifolium subterraneum]